MKFIDNDFILISLIKDGNEKAYDFLFKKYYASLVVFAKKFVPDAEEVVQEVMINLWRNRHKITISSSVKSYLYRATYNTSLNYISKHKSCQKHETIYYNKEQDYLKYADSQEEVIQNMEKAIEELPDLFKDTLKLHKFEKKSYKEIADIYNVTPKAIDYRMQQAFKILREKLIKK